MTYCNRMFRIRAITGWGAGAAGLALACAGAFALWRAPMPEREAARESLDLLHAVALQRAGGQAHVSNCVTAIADASRFETRVDAAQAAVHAAWQQAAGRCARMLDALCEGAPAEAAHDACGQRRPVSF